MEMSKLFIEADTHCHSVASTHAYSTIKEICTSCARKGVKLVALTDHSPAMPDAPHIWHFHNLRSLPRMIEGVTVIRGVEANIVSMDGSLDMDGNELAKLEWTVASFHSPIIKPTTVDEHTSAYIELAKNPLVDVIGHCTTSYFPFDYEKALLEFKKNNKLVEINESSIRSKKSPVENVSELLNLCKIHEVPIVINSDGHYCDVVGEIPLASKIIKEIDFPLDLIVNRKAEGILEYIRAKRGNII